MRKWFVISVVLLAALVAALFHFSRREQQKKQLLLYCAANLRVPIEKIAADFQAETGIEISPQYAGSQTMLTNADVSRRGDLFLPADDSYIELARAKQLIDREFPLAAMRPVVAVKKGNPANIHGIEDLHREGIRLAQANPDAAAIGKVTKPVLEQAKLWEPLKARTVAFHATVTDVANAVKLGTADAGIVWDTTVKQVDGLDAIDLPVFAQTRAKIVLATLRSSKQPDDAAQFGKFARSEKGLKIFESYGYEVVSAK